jgi:hypothetical protein
MKKNKNWAWSTHVPMIKAMIEVFKPELIVELGTGMHSTPEFLKASSKKLFFIDNDSRWLDYIKQENKFDERCEVIFHDLGNGVNLTTTLEEISKEQQKEMKNYFLEFGKKINEIDLDKKFLFVDQFRCSRNMSINLLYNNFDVIVYHDAEAPEWYDYKFDNAIYDNFNYYILKTPTSWTGCFIKKEYNLEKDLFDKISPYITEYCNNINENRTGFYLEKL